MSLKNTNLEGVHIMFRLCKNGKPKIVGRFPKELKNAGVTKKMIEKQFNPITNINTYEDIMRRMMNGVSIAGTIKPKENVESINFSILYDDENMRTDQEQKIINGCFEKHRKIKKRQKLAKQYGQLGIETIKQEGL